MGRKSKPKNEMPILVIGFMAVIMIGGILMYQSTPHYRRETPSPIAVPHRSKSIAVPPGIVKGYCEPDPKLFANIKGRSGASQSAEFDEKKTLSLFPMMAFRNERERTWKKPDRSVIFPPPSPPYSPNMLPPAVVPGERFLEAQNGEVCECKLLPFSFGFKVYDLEGRLMGLTETSSFTFYEYPDVFSSNSGISNDDNVR